MKIRNGFVSNSSSSSFLIVMKNNKVLNKNSLIESFKMDKNSPLFGFANDLSDFLINESEECTIASMHDNYVGHYGEDVLSVDDMIKELVEDISMDKEMLESIKNNKIKVYEGSATDEDGDAISSYLYNSEVCFDTDEISMTYLQ